MSSHNSPNFLSVKGMITPDVESGFFRAWSLRPAIRSNRSSDTGQSSEISPRTTPGPNSPAGTNVKAPRRVKRPGHKRLFSEPALKKSGDSGSSTAALPLDPDPGGIHNQQPALLGKASGGSLCSGSTDSPTSNSSPFRKLVQLSSHCMPAPATNDVKLGRKTRDGSKGILETAGHLVEFITRSRSQADEMHKPTENVVSHAIAASKEFPLGTLASSRIRITVEPQNGQHKGSLAIAQKKSLAGSVQEFVKSAPTTPGRQGLSSRWYERRFGTKHKTEIHHRPKLSPARSLTGLLLQRASTVLKDFTEKKLSPTSSAGSNPSIAPSYSRLAGLSPLYRGHSNASSVTNVHIGKAPLATPATPDSQLWYVGSDAEQYYRVEISEPGAPTYLPSEARRIGTPPMSSYDGRHRGFFFDYNAPDDGGTTPSPDGREGDTLHLRVKRKRPSNSDWYMAKLKADEAEDSATSFELNVPDHLPSSPLCPKHPKHKSGGKGICVYHGRNRDSGGQA